MAAEALTPSAVSRHGIDNAEQIARPFDSMIKGLDYLEHVRHKNCKHIFVSIKINSGKM